jgi:hypothetical protein
MVLKELPAGAYMIPSHSPSWNRRQGQPAVTMVVSVHPDAPPPFANAESHARLVRSSGRSRVIVFYRDRPYQICTNRTPNGPRTASSTAFFVRDPTFP